MHGAIHQLGGEHDATQRLLEARRDAEVLGQSQAGAEWRMLYGDQSVTKWLQQVTDFFASTGNIPNPVPASQYFDPSIFMDATKA